MLDDVELKSELKRIRRMSDGNSEVQARVDAVLSVLPQKVDVWLDALETGRDAAHVRDLEIADMPFRDIVALYERMLADALAASSAHDDPFPHIRFGKVLDEDIYRALTRNMPPHSAFRPRAKAAAWRDGAFQRYELQLRSKALEGLGGTRRKLWLGLAGALEAAPTVEAICRKLGLRVPASWRVDTRIMVDRDGFGMRPHTDGGNGAVYTLQFYLPKDRSLAATGTEFFERRADGSFRIDHKAEFLPNTGHGFAITPHSWHGLVTRIPDLAEGRASVVTRLISQDGGAKAGGNQTVFSMERQRIFTLEREVERLQAELDRAGAGRSPLRALLDRLRRRSRG